MTNIFDDVETELSPSKPSLLFRIVPIFIGFVFFLIIAWFIFVGVSAYRVAKDPEGAARRAGEIAAQFENGYQHSAR